MAKVIVTAAITGGIHTPSMSPYLPITPKQIADEAVRSSMFIPVIQKQENRSLMWG